MARQPTTQNVVKAKKRKERNKAQRNAKNTAEAARLGISVNQLRLQQAQEVRRIRVRRGGGIYVSRPGGGHDPFADYH